MKKRKIHPHSELELTKTIITSLNHLEFGQIYGGADKPKDPKDPKAPTPTPIPTPIPTFTSGGNDCRTMMGFDAPLF